MIEITLFKRWFTVCFLFCSLLVCSQNTLDYFEGFEGTTASPFQFANGNEANKWYIGTATKNGGSNGLYISGDNTGASNSYSNIHSITHAYTKISAPGVDLINLSFDFKMIGEFKGNNYLDYLEVWLVMDSEPITAGNTFTVTNGINIGKAANFYNKNTWTGFTAPNINVSSFQGNFKLVFTWVNNDKTNNQPPAAIDNISLSAACNAPLVGNASNITASGATLNWSAALPAPANGYEYYYSTSATPPTSATVPNGSTAAGVTSVNITGINTENTYYYWVRSVCSSTKKSVWSAVSSFSFYCKPTSSSPGRLYIDKFQFVGVLNNPPANLSSAGVNGYENFTNFTPIAEQPQGSVINVAATSKSTSTSFGGWKAWVDFNNDGVFDNTPLKLDVNQNYVSGEMVFTMVEYQTPAITFGFVLPKNIAVGTYRMRIGTWGTINDDAGFKPCINLDRGEMEDYLFKIVADCPAKIISVNKVNQFDGERCGTGSVRLSATGNSSATDYKWYDSVYGGNLLGTGNVFYTPSISQTTTYYVTAVSAGCETPFRYPVVARIDPQPTVIFSKTPNVPVCGEDIKSINVTASGDKYQEVYTERFDNSLGIFLSNTQTDTTLYNTATKGRWQHSLSPYYPTKPTYAGTSPALSSGYFGGNFATMNTDYSRSLPILNELVNQDNSLDVRGFLNLKVEFDLYYFSIAENDTDGYLSVDYHDGVSWKNILKRNNATEPNPLNWEKISIDIPSPAGAGMPFTTNNFKIRFTVKANGYSSGFIESITAVDNIKLSGFKLIDTPFTWSSSKVVLYDDKCENPIGATLASTVCVKPNATEIMEPNWQLDVSATFSNGCPAIGSTFVDNDTKTWVQPTKNWNVGSDWRPVNVPTINKCVIIRTPVQIDNLDGFAKNVIVKPGGKLELKNNSSLTLQTYLKNQAASADVIVNSDNNLVQIDDSAVNEGPITVKRNAQMKRLDYNYWGAPVTGQTFIGFSPYTVKSRFYTYNDRDDGFYTITNVNSPFIPGKGYAIRAPDNFTSTTQTFEGTFIGVPNNGTQPTFPLKYNLKGGTVDIYNGYNMISNPYPSNLDLGKLTSANSGITDGVYYFWTNDAYSHYETVSSFYGGQYGKYTFNQYAILNVLGSTPATSVATNSLKMPSKIIKPGQGFIIKAKASGTLVFKNNMRTAATKDDGNINATFFNRLKNDTSKESTGLIAGRFWLSIISPVSTRNTLLVGYASDANNDYDSKYDVQVMGSSADNVYSIINNKAYRIQGRNPLDLENDVVKLGVSHYMPGSYNLKIENKDGIFDTDQKIFIKDNVLNTVTELTESGYEYTVTASGVDESRFEIVFTAVASALGVSDTNLQSDLQVYKKGEDFIIKSRSKIDKVEVYEGSGKLGKIIDKANTNQLTLNFKGMSHGLYILKIYRQGRVTSEKIIN